MGSMRDRLREEAKKSTTEGASYLKLSSKVNFFQPKEEEYELDCIPFETTVSKHPKGYEKGELRAYLRFKIHAGIGAEDNKYVCPTTIGKPCPICIERAKMAKSSNGNLELIKALTPKERTLFQVIDLKEEKKGIQLFDLSYHLFAKRLLMDIDKTENSTGGRKRSTAHAGFAELEGGQTLFVSFIEKKMGTNKFYEASRIDAEDREPYEEAILDDVLDLDDCLKILDYDDLEAIFLEVDPEEQGSNRKREEPEGRDGGRSTRKSREAPAEEEEEPAALSHRRRGATEKEEEPPSRTRRTKAVEKEEEPEEKPATRTRRGKAVEKEEEPEEPVTRSSRRGRIVKEEEPEEPVRSRRGRTEEKEDTRCWVKGGVFGKDCDSHKAEAPNPNCYDCPEETWKACKQKQIEMEQG